MAENKSKNYLMPIYEYKCSKCGNHLEKMQKIADAPLAVCEICGGKLEKQWSLSGIQFKGAGWYVTDYSSKLKEPGATKTDKSEKSEKLETGDKSGKPEKSEKSSAAESNAKSESASNTASDTKTASVVKETAAKKD